MTRINTNVSSLNAQKTLAKSNAELQQALTRLSTGLRINSGKDDPAGLIASETLRSDIVSTERAITNSERANQMIATADSALGQVSSLLNDIRGLVSEAANSGAMSTDQIAANQLQVDSSLDAIDRIAQVTQFQGKRLLDGSLDFITENVDRDQITSVKIDQANFGTQTQISVSAEVAAQATKAQLSYDGATLTEDVVLEIGGANGFEAFSFGAGSSIAQLADAINLVSDALGVTASTTGVRSWEEGTGSLALTSYGADNDLVITADAAGQANGAYSVHYYQGTSATTSTVTFSAATANAAGSIEVALEATTEWGQAVYTLNNAGVGVKATTGFSVTARTAGTEFNGISLVTHDIATLAGAEYMTYNHDLKQLHIYMETGAGNSSVSSVVNSVMDQANWGNGAELSEIFRLFSFARLSAGSTATYAAGTNFQAALAGGSTTLGTDLSGVAATATATNIRALINAAGTGFVSAALATGETGAGVVTIFDEYALVGSNPTYYPTANNYIQFLASENAPNVRFAATTASQSLSYDLTSEPATTAGSSIYLGGNHANSTLKITATQPGGEYDNVLVTIQQGAVGAEESVTWDPTANSGNGALTIRADIASGYTVMQAVNLINGNSYVNNFWHAETVAGTGAGTLSVATSSTQLTSGGVVSKGTLIVNLATDSNGRVTSTANDVVNLFTNAADPALQTLGLTVSNAQGSNGAGLVTATTSDVQFIAAGVTRTDAQASGTTHAVNGIDAGVTVTARNSGSAYNGVTVKYTVDASITNPNLPEVVYHESSKELEVLINAATTATYVAAAINRDASVSQLFSAIAAGAGTSAVTVNDFGILSGGVSETGTPSGAWLLGNQDAGSTTVNGMLTFNANEYGSKGFVSIKPIEGSFVVTDENGAVKDRDYGSDIDVRINGIQAIGEGLKATINTSALDLSLWMDETVLAGVTSSFSIVGGGAQFQLGPDVVSNQQARIGITSVSTATLGGVGEHGRLFQIRSGNAYDLSTDTASAATIVEDVITQITTLRGRLGALQSTTLQTNIDALSDTLEALTQAESQIRDADFAAESSALTRAQILVQSGISVLSIANQNPQNVLSLLQ